MKASLPDIEKAIRANFVINPDGKFLETGGDRIDLRLKSGARMVFIGLAMAYGHRVEDILQYVTMDLREFNSLFAKYHDLNESGRAKYEHRKLQGKKTYTEAEAYDLDLRTYRKTILVNNHILITKLQRVNMI